MKKIIEDLYINKELGEFYCYPVENSFYVGYIVAYSNTELLLHTFTRFGMDDGLLYILLDDLAKIIKGNKYLDTFKGMLCDVNNYEIELDDGILKGLLSYTSDNHMIADIELDNTEAENEVGFVRNIREETIELEQIGFFGERDGISVMYKDDITKVIVNSEENVRRYKLFLKNNRLS